MNAAVVHAFDAPPRYAAFDDPEPRPGEQLVHVRAAGLHQIVRSVAKGAHYTSTGQVPFVPGVDGVGTLDDGTRVYFGAARPPFGSMAKLSLASPAICLPLPDTIDDVTAAGIANPAMSSSVALTARAHFTSGENVLILGATGTSGRLAVQIARRMGAGRVVALGRNPQSLKELPALGADSVISLEQSHDVLMGALKAEFAGPGVHVVLDYLWGQPAELTLQAISQVRDSWASPRIRYVQIGSMAGATIPLSAATLRGSRVELLGSGFGSASLDQIREALRAFFAAAATQPFDFRATPAPLTDVEKLWNDKSQGDRLVFLP